MLSWIDPLWILFNLSSGPGLWQGGKIAMFTEDYSIHKQCFYTVPWSLPASVEYPQDRPSRGCRGLLHADVLCAVTPPKDDFMFSYN